MKRQYRCFARRVVCHSCHSDVTRRTSYGDYMSLVLSNHVRQEGLDRVPIAQDIYIEELTQVCVRGVKDGVAGEDAGVVDEDAGSAEDGFNLLCCRVYSFWVRNVAVEELDSGVWHHVFMLISLFFFHLEI